MKKLFIKITILLLGILLFFPVSIDCRTKRKNYFRVTGELVTVHLHNFNCRTYAIRIYNQKRDAIGGSEVIVDNIIIPEISQGYHSLNTGTPYSPPSKLEKATIHPGKYSITGYSSSDMIEAEALIGNPVKILTPAREASIPINKNLKAFITFSWSPSTDSFTFWIMRLTENDQSIGPQLFKHENYHGNSINVPTSILESEEKYVFELLQNLSDLPFVKGNVTTDSKIRRFIRYWRYFNTKTRTK